VWETKKNLVSIAAVLSNKNLTWVAVFIPVQPASHPNEKSLDRLNKKHLQFAGT
jgi:hypothetical protein